MRFERMSMSGARALAMAVAAGGSIAGVAAGDAVEWRVEDGGNGHWYELRDEVMNWQAAREVALGIGGDLASIETAAEWMWVKPRFLTPRSHVNLGGFQANGATSPSMNWMWLSGEALDPSAIGVQLLVDDNPCGCGQSGENGEQDYLHSAFNAQYLGDCNDGAGYPCQGGCAWETPFLIEWSADCNANGVVDFGEIRNGLATDANGDHIPDECQCATHPGLCCDGDVIESGTVDGVDLAAILATWGTDGGKYPRADVDGSGVVDGADLAIVLGDWGPCE